MLGILFFDVVISFLKQMIILALFSSKGAAEHGSVSMKISLGMQRQNALAYIQSDYIGVCAK